jgi:hypothetical protein
MAQRPTVLVDLVVDLLGVPSVQHVLQPSNRLLTLDLCRNLLQDLQAILDHQLDRPHREVIHLLGFDPNSFLSLLDIKDGNAELGITSICYSNPYLKEVP